MRTTFKTELLQARLFYQEYGQATGVIVVATALMVMVNSPALQVFNNTYTESLVFYGALPCIFLLLLGHAPHALALGLGRWRFWLPASAGYLLVALPLIFIGGKNTTVNHY